MSYLTENTSQPQTVRVMSHYMPDAQLFPQSQTASNREHYCYYRNCLLGFRACRQQKSRSIPLSLSLSYIYLSHGNLGVTTPTTKVNTVWLIHTHTHTQTRVLHRVGYYYYYHHHHLRLLSQAFSSWYFSWTSGDPHRSGFKFHTAVLSVLCVTFQVLLLLLLLLLLPSYLRTTYRPTPSLHGGIHLNVKHMSLFLLKSFFFGGGGPVDSKRARILRLCLHFQYRLNSPHDIKEILLKLVGSLFN